MMSYDPEVYWTRVAGEIARRPDASALSGDCDPFHAYQRRKMLKRFLDPLEVAGRTVLEVGCGPGGNLLHLQRFRPARSIGVDVSSRMLDLARQRLQGHEHVELLKTDGRRIELSDHIADVTFTVTVLMHISDDAMFRSVVSELCRLTKHTLVLIEQTTRRSAGDITADGHGVRRRVDEYADAVRAHGLLLRSTEDLRVRVSRAGWGRAVRLAGRIARKEGEPESALARLLGSSWLLASRWVDDVVPDDMTLTKQTFVRPVGQSATS
jgi:SAM-dependent methyltransferase